MKFLILSVFFLSAAGEASKGAKRKAYALPAGFHIFVVPVKTTFSCFNDGYYADVDNGCAIFHVCHSVEREDGSKETRQWSFICDNQNQLTLSCSDPEGGVSCSEATTFYNTSDRFTAEDPELNLVDEEVEKASPSHTGQDISQMDQPSQRS
ncbi:uncharacterized protein LOC118197505 [Stegodyphus dumicola]|uniref:uncharacterized protein LOC118197505 n=1 Tax=Stegodyphus dumicola TaxID=202533 RepID=UPI0015B030BF|nr:uncharacterized protein LOC118197505 [Stegodyphus dumicola]